MMRTALRLWPATLAARLALLLLLALAASQVALIVVLRLSEDAVVQEMGHGQAMTQTVSLVRLPSLYPPDQGDTLASAFGSLTSCAIVSRVRAPEIPMSEAESHLARLLAPMLHGVQVGAPLASIESPAQSPLCPN